MAIGKIAKLGTDLLDRSARDRTAKNEGIGAKPGDPAFAKKPDQFGLINRARQPEPQNEPEKIQPVMSEVRPEDTVEGRITNLTGTDSKYMQVARQGAKAEANRRGLVNSSIAAGAAEAAVIREARPIAEADAKTYSTTRLENQRTQNQFLSNEQSAELNKELAKYKGDVQLESDRIMNDEKFSDQVKLNYTTAIVDIGKDAQQQIADIGLSDRSANAQHSAIKQVEKNREAQILVYQDLLRSFPDWKWSVDFTQQ